MSLPKASGQLLIPPPRQLHVLFIYANPFSSTDHLAAKFTPSLKISYDGILPSLCVYARDRATLPPSHPPAVRRSVETFAENEINFEYC